MVKVTSVDISEYMLSLAKKLNPEMNYQYGDMRIIRLEERFDAVTILDSVNYIKTVEDLQRTFITKYSKLSIDIFYITVCRTATMIIKFGGGGGI